MTYCFDLDGTLCSHEKNYSNATHFPERISKVNGLYDSGHRILIDTARGATTGIDWTEITEKQLHKWKVKYHKLRVGHKPNSDIFVDDKGINDKDFFKLTDGQSADDTTWNFNYLMEINNHLQSDNLFENITNTKKAILKARKDKKKVIFAGNGTSSLIATRGAMSMLGQLGIKCTSVNDPAFITAVANDFGYEDIFTRYINLYAEKGDVVVLISASGKSKNVVNSSAQAKEKGCTIITFSGFKTDNPLKKSGDINFWTSCKNYSKVESVHSVWMGMVCDFILKDEKHKVGLHGIEF